MAAFGGLRQEICLFARMKSRRAKWDLHSNAIKISGMNVVPDTTGDGHPGTHRQDITQVDPMTASDTV
jgi:hypothetical protein